MVSTMNEIMPRLWISGEHTASNLNSLAKSRITHVVTLTGYTPFPDKIDYLVFDIQESLTANIMNVCLLSSEWIATKLAHPFNGVLVHCSTGVSRSGAVIIAYLILKCGMSYKLAFTKAILRRHQILPNSNFVFQLKYLDFLFNNDLSEWQDPPYISITYKMTEFTTPYILFHVDMLQKYKVINFYTTLTTIELPTTNPNFNIVPIHNLHFVALVELIKPTDGVEYTLQIGHNETITLFLLYNHLVLHGYRKPADVLSEINISPKEYQLLLTYYESKVLPSVQLILELEEIPGESVDQFYCFGIPAVEKKKKELLLTRSIN